MNSVSPASVTAPDPAPESLADFIASAVEIPDPLEGLAERTAANAGAPFEPETLAALANLRRNHLAAFEALRERLKRAGCRVTRLDQAISAASGEERPSPADRLIGYAKAAALFHTADGTGFADVEVNGHRETWAIRSEGFKGWLRRRFYEETNGAPPSEALQTALGTIEAMAVHGGPERKVYIRVGEHEGRHYLDLGDAAWRAVEIDATGWRIVEAPPVRFGRAPGMEALPVPEPGGAIDDLRPFLNVANDGDFVLAVAWLLAALRCHGPYPVLALSGEQGSAKSTFSRIMRALIDPRTVPLRSLPRDDQAFFIAAANGFVLAFDNLSGLPAAVSDTLCCLATGGGFATRRLYSDQEEVLFTAARPMILNGIEDIVTRPDLADRSLFLTLEPIPEDQRRTERELWAAFEAARPRILGALLDAMVTGIERFPATRLAKMPRMADFAKWATACETALWPAGTFMTAYSRNRKEVVAGVLEADLVASAVRDLMEAQAEWTGTATQLLEALAGVAGERAAKARSWPKTPRTLSGHLRRSATFLRTAGIAVENLREGKGRKRMIRLARTQTARADARADEADDGVSVCVRALNSPKPLETLDNPNGADDADEADAKMQALSGVNAHAWSGRL